VISFWPEERVPVPERALELVREETSTLLILSGAAIIRLESIEAWIVGESRLVGEVEIVGRGLMVGEEVWNWDFG